MNNTNTKTGEEKNKKDLSLYLYTSLIFIVSILMILIAYAGQSYFMSDSKKSLAEKANTLSQDFARVTNENATLIQAKNSLSDLNSTLNSKITTLEKDNDNLIHKNTILNKLLKIETFLEEDNILEAQNLYSEIDANHIKTLNDADITTHYDKITLSITNFGMQTPENVILYNLLKIDSLLDEKEFTEAKTIYDTIDVNALNADQKAYYDKITLRLNK